MNTARFHASTLRTLLKKQKIATIDELKAALGSQTSVTVFRKLAELSYLTSYSHGDPDYELMGEPSANVSICYHAKRCAGPFCWITEFRWMTIPRSERFARMSSGEN